MTELYNHIGDAPEGIEALLNSVVKECCKAEGISEALVCVTFVAKEEIRALNRETRGVDSETDVLSFPTVNYVYPKTARDSEKKLASQRDYDTGMVYLGDCVISLDAARAQAREYGHSLEREIGYLAAHSVLHLMGYDHMEERDKRVMRDMEKKIMNGLRLWRNPMSYEQLFSLACEAMEKAYSPYSKFKVGACLLGADGNTYKGCNFENASYGATICAERCAASNAIINGCREFKAIAIVGSSAVAWPCGICRQVLAEFSRPDMPVIVGEYGKPFTVKTLGELLPCCMTGEDIDVDTKAE